MLTFFSVTLRDSEESQKGILPTGHIACRRYRPSEIPSLDQVQGRNDSF